MRGWHELVAAVGDPVPGGVPVLGLLLLVLAALTGVLWYWWPEWLPSRRARGGGTARRRRWRRPRFRGWWGRWRLRWSAWRGRWRWRRRRRTEPDAPVDHPAEELPETLPELPAAALALSADELAARGRFREAVRERLRAIVRDLVERGVIDSHPGWTVTELAGAAGGARPDTAPALAEASEIFSRIWYGQWPARAADDAAMRECAAGVRAALDGHRVGV